MKHLYLYLLAIMSDSPTPPDLSVQSATQKQAPKLFDANLIIDVICKHYGLNIADLRSPNRTKCVVTARQITMYFMRKMLPDLSLHAIGLTLGRSDHTTVLHAIDKIETLARRTPSFLKHLKELEAEILS